MIKMTLTYHCAVLIDNDLNNVIDEVTTRIDKPQSLASRTFPFVNKNHTDTPKTPPSQSSFASLSHTVEQPIRVDTTVIEFFEF